MSYKGLYRGLYRGFSGETRSLDYGSYSYKSISTGHDVGLAIRRCNFRILSA